MFKINESTTIFLYLLGIVLMFVLLFLIARDVAPFALGRLMQLNNNEIALQKPEFNLNPNKDYKAIISTNKGDILVDLFEKNAPLNVNNFVYLSKKNYYQNVLFHRVIKDILIQTGDRNTINRNLEYYGFGNPGYFIEDEVNWDTIELNEIQRRNLESIGYRSNNRVTTKKINKYYMLMANNGPNTNGSQFFILTTPFNDAILEQLEGRFTPIGRVINGFEVVDEINNIETQNFIPTNDIYIRNIIVIEK